MTFTASYAGRCRSDDCNYGDNRITIGDECEYFEEEIMHTECAARQRRELPHHRGEC